MLLNCGLGGWGEKQKVTPKKEKRIHVVKLGFPAAGKNSSYTLKCRGSWSLGQCKKYHSYKHLDLKTDMTSSVMQLQGGSE